MATRQVLLSVGAAAVGVMGVVGCSEDFPDGRVDAVDADTGEVRWQVDVEHPLVGAAGIAHGLLVVWGRDRCDGPAYLVVHDAVSGEARWSVGPVDAAGSLEVNTSGDMVLGADDVEVVAWALSSGMERWRERVVGNVDVRIAADDAGIVTSASEAPLASARITDHDPVTGDGRWSVSLEAGRQVIDMALTGDLVLVRTWGAVTPALTPTTEVQALDRTDGTTRWRTDIGVSETAPPLVVNGEVVVAALSTIAFSVPDGAGGTRDLGPSSSVVALQTTDGATRWRLDRPSPAPSGPTRDAPGGVTVFDADALTVVGRDRSALVAWDAATGTERWRTEFGAGAAWVESQLVVATELVPFDRSSHAVRAFQLDTGELQWTIQTPRPVVSVSDNIANLVLVQTGDGPGCSD